MAKISRMVLAGFLALVAASQSLWAQGGMVVTPPQEVREPLYFCGVANEGSLFLTTQGSTYTFPIDERPRAESFQPRPGDTPWWTFVTSTDANQNVVSMYGFPSNGGFPQPTYLVGSISLRNGTTVVAFRELHIILFSTATHRDAFLYYIQQREAAATDIDYDYYTSWADYEFWMGQEKEYLALYTLYHGLAYYYRDTTADPKLSQFYLYYYEGLAAYYWYAGQGYQEQADVVWAYCYQLALEALHGE